MTERFEDHPDAGRVFPGRLLKELTAGPMGSFDFGALPADDYELSVTLPSEESVVFHLTIDPSAHNTDVLIDISPGYYCTCCGWNFEPQ